MKSPLFQKKNAPGRRAIGGKLLAIGEHVVLPIVAVFLPSGKLTVKFASLAAAGIIKVLRSDKTGECQVIRQK